MKFVLTFISLFIVSHNLSSQGLDDSKAHRRYWYHRTRLINDFMKIGKEQGDCILFAERNDGKSTSGNSKNSKPGPDQIDIINHYIMALSLEYKLLSRGNQDVSETIKELYHLLYTVNRLDIEAESIWHDPAPTAPDHQIPKINGNLNGYMIREDMPPNYIKKNLEHFNFALQLNQGSNQSFCGNDFTDSVVGTKFIDYLDNKGINEKKEMAMPLDKFHSMLVAMMFVNKYIPEGVTYGSEKFQDDEASIKKEAGNIAKRIYTYIKGDGTWQLRNPDNSFLTTDPGNSTDVSHIANLYSYPLSRIACYANRNFPWNISTDCLNYSDIVSVSIGKNLYKSWSKVPAPYAQDVAVFMAWDVAGSNLPSSVIPPLPAYITMTANSNHWHIEWAELLRKVLHQDGVLLKPQSFYENQISQAPCFGPYNYSENYEGNYGNWEWSAQDLLEHPNARGCHISCFNGNYPGVDYMLLHNLFYEYQNQLLDGNSGNTNTISGQLGNIITTIYNTLNGVGNTLSGWFSGNNSSNGNSGTGSSLQIHPYYGYNLMDNYDENVWPNKATYKHGFGAGSYNETVYHGILSNPKYIAMYQNLTSIAHIYAKNSPAAPENSETSSVIYRAGKEITLLPGFQVDAGSEFHARVERFLCNNSGQSGEALRIMKDSLYSVTYEDDNYTEIPIHYRKY